MNLICYPRLSTCSKRAIVRTKKRWGHPVNYTPKAPLLKRLSVELGLTEEQVYKQLYREREWLLQHIRYFR